MIDEKKIEEAKRAFIAGVISIIDLSCGFKEGAKWMQEEFLKGFWHPASEESEEFNYYGFASLYIIQENCQIRRVLYDKKHMNWKNVININESWCYVYDLFPKKGGEK